MGAKKMTGILLLLMDRQTAYIKLLESIIKDLQGGIQAARDMLDGAEATLWQLKKPPIIKGA